MKKIKFGLFFMSLFFGMQSLYAVEKNDESSILQNKIYVDKNKNVYVNQKAPLYFRLSTTPNGGGESVILYNVGSKDRKNDPKPMRFKGAGVHNLSHFHSNKKGDPTQNFRLVIDSKGPSMTYNYKGAPQYHDGKSLYMGEPVTLSLKARDFLSGVNKTFISVNDKKFESYTKPLLFNKEQNYDLITYSMDNVGNRSHDTNINFILDLTPPQSAYLTQGLRIKNVFSRNVKIALKSKDIGSKVKTIFFGFSSKKFNKKGLYGSEPLSLEKMPDGPYKFFYYGLDNVKNKEDRKAMEFYLDKTPPTFSAKVIGDQFKNKVLYVSQRSKINLTAKDAQVPVKKIIWKFKYGVYKKYEKDFLLPKVLGAHEITYTAIDQLNNWGQSKKLNVILDLLPPVITQTFSGPHISVFEKIFISKKTKVIFNAKDNGSGVKSILYKINNGEHETYTSPLSLKEEGVYQFTFHSIDNVNNEQTPNNSKIVVDNTPPEIFHHFSNTGLGKMKKGNKELVVYFPGSRLFLAASDKKSGTSSISYKINGVLKAHKGPLQLWNKGNYTVEIFAKDRVGNYSKKSISFIIGNKI